jgi:hypothetical protein
MYVPFPPNDPLSQGDIIENVVLPYIPLISAPTLIIDDQVVERDLSKPFDRSENLTALAPVQKSTVIVISQGCDIDHQPFISIARVAPIVGTDNGYPTGKNAKTIGKYIREHYQKIGVRPRFYYLKAEESLPPSVVLFPEIHTLLNTPENAGYLQSNRLLRLTREAVEDLQFRLSFFFGRFAALADDYMLTEDERTANR